MLSSEQMDFALELWKSVGLEIVIFVVTLICAYLLRVPLSGKAGTRHKDRHKILLASEPSYEPGPERQAKVPARGESKEKSQGPRRPSDVLDEAMDCLRDWQDGGGQAGRVLSLYSELRQQLRISRQRLQVAAQQSRHRPLLFYSGLVQLVIRTGKHDMVIMIIDDMIQQGVPRSLSFYESAMKQLAVHKHYKLALSVYDKLVADGMETTATTYSCLVRFATEVGDLARAKEVFEKLSSLTTPSIRAYMTILGVHNKRQDWHAARATIRDMVSRGVPVDSLAMNVALSAGVAADKVAELEDFLSEAEQMSPRVLDVVSYNTVAKGYAQKNKYWDAYKVIGRMRVHGVEPNAITFNTVMDAAVRSGKAEEAWNRLQEMRESGFRPDKFTGSILVKSLSRAAGPLTCEVVDRALALLEEVDGCIDMNLRTTLYNTVTDACSKEASLHSSLLKAAAQMRAKGVTTTSVLQKTMVNALRRKEP